jgi:hypothetical protein
MPFRVVGVHSITSNNATQELSAKVDSGAYGNRHGADNWTKAERRTFANDYDNLLVVDDSTNQSKSSQALHEWLPPNKGYWCKYGERWQRVKDKY